MILIADSHPDTCRERLAARRGLGPNDERLLPRHQAFVTEKSQDSFFRHWLDQRGRRVFHVVNVHHSRRRGETELTLIGTGLRIILSCGVSVPSRRDFHSDLERGRLATLDSRGHDAGFNLGNGSFKGAATTLATPAAEWIVIRL